MSDRGTSPNISAARRARHAALAPTNWLQFARYAAVGLVGYAVSVAAFAALVHVAHTSTVVAATAAFGCALATNFVCNRYWTFRAHAGHAGHQATRFAVVNVVAFLYSLVALRLLIDAGLDPVAAEALAVLSAAPPNYLANRLWSFRT